MKRWVASVCLVSLLCLSAPPRAEAAWPVIDVAAIAHLVTQIKAWIQDAALQVKQIANQVLQLQQMALMVQSWALALKNMDFTVLLGIGGPMGDIVEVFAMAQQAFFNAALFKEQFDELFSPFNTGQFTGDGLFFTKAFDWNEAQRRAHWVAMQQQSHLHLTLEAGMQGLTASLNRSRGAVGHLQGIQAGNNLIGLQVAQQMETNALLGTMAHTASVRDMMEASVRDQALLRLCQAMEGWSAVPETDGLDDLPTTLR